MRNVRSRKHAAAQAEYLARLEHLAKERGERLNATVARKLFYRGLTPTEALSTHANMRSAAQ